MSNTIKIVGGIVIAGIILAGIILWAVLLKTPAAPTQNTPATSFGQADARTNVAVGDETATNVGTSITSPISTQRVFKITDGPIAGATLLNMTRPTTTIVRFVQQTNGHIMDLTLDSPGAVAKPVSNITIPSISNVVWSEQGRGALAQYLDVDALKTAHLALPAPATTTPAVSVQFLPSNISSVAVSPDGTHIAYLFKTNSGSDGYTASADGGSAKKLFSLPFSQTTITWPSAGTLLAQTAPASGVSGVVYSIDVKNGSVATLLFAQGLSAIADQLFSRIVYQINDASRSTYVHTVKTGLDVPLSFSPLPEQCIWSQTNINVMYCVTPISGAEADYVDAWHQGTVAVSDAIIAYDISTGRSNAVASPGSSDGGEAADIAEMALSPDDHYLIYIRKGDRSLWGVRLVGSAPTAQQ